MLKNIGLVQESNNGDEALAKVKLTRVFLLCCEWTPNNKESGSERPWALSLLSNTQTSASVPYI